MIGKLADLSAKRFYKNASLYNDAETYKYAFFIIYSSVALAVFTAFVGVIFKVLSESLIFFVCFFFIRIFAGGYHADTERRCEIISCSCVFICTGLLRLAKTYNFKHPLLSITVISIMLIFILSPLGTPEKPLNDSEKRRFRKISRLVLLILSSAVVGSAIFEIYFLMYPIALSLILESLFLSAGKVKQLKNK